MRRIGQIALVLYGLGLLGFGILFLLSPEQLTSQVGTEMPTATSMMDIRAVYGGLFAGVGAFWVYSARTPALQRPGLVSLAFAMVGLVIGRTVGLTDGSPNALIIGLFAVEVIGAAVAIAALRAQRAR